MIDKRNTGKEKKKSNKGFPFKKGGSRRIKGVEQGGEK